MTYRTAEDMFASMNAYWDASPWHYKARVLARRYHARFDYLRRQPRFMWQRARRGYSDQDTWGIHYYLARVIVGAVSQLRDRDISYPPDLTPEKWTEILNDIVTGFEAFLALDAVAYDDLPTTGAALEERFRRGAELFVEYYHHLWD